MNKQRLKKIADNNAYGADLIVPWSEVAQMARELLALREEIQKPAEQCENCDDYYAASVMRTTADDVTLCPGCWEACCKDDAALNPPEAEQG